MRKVWFFGKCAPYTFSSSDVFRFGLLLHFVSSAVIAHMVSLSVSPNGGAIRLLGFVKTPTPPSHHRVKTHRHKTLNMGILLDQRGQKRFTR